MLRRHHQISATENRIHSRREYLNKLVCFFIIGNWIIVWKLEIGNWKFYNRSLRFPDPISLILLRMLRPIDFIQIINKFFGKIGDFEKPTRHFFEFDIGSATLAFAFHYLLVGNYRLARSAPVRLGCFFIHQSVFEKFPENPLRPFVITRIGSNRLFVKIILKSQRLHLPDIILHIFLRSFRRMDSGFDGEIFRRKSEGIKSLRMKNIETLHFFEAVKNIAGGITFRMPHMQSRSGRIRKHIQNVKLIF
ncbi:MAG: hypothetical protein ACD_11C00098G0003 [uncultured bacterium]|nr:MAG: hypothetical protein ACD_11C00098G0003 [uncultured bacterium]